MSISTQATEAAVISDLNVIKLREDSTAKFDNEWTKENLTLTVLPPPDKDTVQPLQTGSFGLVYRVVHEGIKEKIKKYDGQAEFAAKIIPKRYDLRGRQLKKEEIEDTKNRAIKEAYNLMELSHRSPHILNCYGVFENNDYWCLVTEYAEYGDLLSLFFKENKYFPEARLAYYIRQLCEGIAFLHKEYIHLDIKPDNLFIINKRKPIYLSQNELLVIGDLQYLSKKNSTGKVPGVIGTENYVAPEIVLESETGCTDKADMWSIGVTTFGLLFNSFLYPTIRKQCRNLLPEKQRPGDVLEFITTDYDRYKARLQKTHIINYLIDKEQNKHLTEGKALVSFKAIDFVRKCLQRDPSKRISAKDALTQPESWLYRESIEEAIRQDFEVKGTWRRTKGKVMARETKRVIEQKHAHSWHSRMASGSSSQDECTRKKNDKNAGDEHQDKHASPAQKRLEEIQEGLERHGSNKRRSTDTSGSCISM